MVAGCAGAGDALDSRMRRRRRAAASIASPRRRATPALTGLSCPSRGVRSQPPGRARRPGSVHLRGQDTPDLRPTEQDDRDEPRSRRPRDRGAGGTAAVENDWQPVIEHYPCAELARVGTRSRTRSRERSRRRCLRSPSRRRPGVAGQSSRTRTWPWPGRCLPHQGLKQHRRRERRRE